MKVVDLTRSLRALVLFAGLVAFPACGPKRADLGADLGLDPQTVLDRARAPSSPFALRASYGVKIGTGKGTVATRGTLLLHQPDRMRVDVLGGMGTPVVSLISDGRALAVWNGQEPAFYRTDDAAAALEALTGGAVHLDDAVDLLAGRLPLADAQIVSVRTTDAGVAVTLQAAANVLADAVLDPETALLRSIVVHKTEGEALVSLAYGEPMKVGKRRLPGSIALDVPSLALKVDIDVTAWEELGVVPDAFATTPPGAMVAKDLIEGIRIAAEKAGYLRP